MTKKRLHSLFIVGFFMIMYDLTGCFYDHEKHQNASEITNREGNTDIKPVKTNVPSHNAQVKPVYLSY